MPDKEMLVPEEMSFILLICGSEILIGKRQDKHIRLITRSLLPYGLNCARVEVVGDDFDSFTASLRRALQEVDLVLVTGGLGPTVDDITRECISEATGIPMVESAEALEQIIARFRAMGREMKDNNRRQAMIPTQGSFISNPNGTAPGLIYDTGSQVVLALPGPPHELEPMLMDSVLPYLQQRFTLLNQTITHPMFFCCLGESSVDHVIRHYWKDEPDIAVSLLAHLGVVELTLSLKDPSGHGQERLEQFAQKIRSKLGSYVFSETGEPIEKVVGNLLRSRGETLAVAESCTGGMLGEWLTRAPGSSDYFLGGVISYSNDVKCTLVGVEEKTIADCGAVSRECAAEMAKGVCATLGSTWGLAITGIAGPGGGTPEKPAGTVWIALAHREGMVYPFKSSLIGDRDSVRYRACVFALDQLRRAILGLPLYDEGN